MYILKCFFLLILLLTAEAECDCWVSSRLWTDSGMVSPGCMAERWVMSELCPLKLILIHFAAFRCPRFVVIANSWNGVFILVSSTGGCIQLGLQGQTSVLALGINADLVAFGTFTPAMMAG